ncbi:hypothetical protein JCM10213_004924 [Rhodosporidiobolus nylandii]
MAPDSAPATASGKPKKPRKEKIVSCNYCDMTFKKLEHLQRHERTHTLDRPYQCDTCSKTFARQDTLHRHERLHKGKDDDSPPAPKGPKKRRVSNAATSPKPVASTSEGSSTSPSIDPSSSSDNSLPQPIEVEPVVSSSRASCSQPITVPTSEGSPSFAGLGLSASLPVVPPSFPAYSQPEVRSVDPSSLALPRRLSNVEFGSTLPSRHDGASPGGATTFPSQISAFSSSGVAAAGEGGRSARLGARPRALTLAGLPESLGCFSLVNSPAPSDAGDSSSVSGDEEDSDDLNKTSSVSSDGGEAGGIDWTNPFSPQPPESHYPSPAFSCYSPSALRADPLSDLQAILDNDPIPASFHSQPSPPPAQPDFDFEAFAASIEGPRPSSAAKEAATAAHVPTSLEELLNNAANHLLGVKPGATDDADRYPTPPFGSASPTSLPAASSAASYSPALISHAAASFDLGAHLTALASEADAQQQAREAAATAALFGGFGLSHSASSSAPSIPASTSSLGLNFGFPTPQPSFFPPVSRFHPTPPPQRGLSLPVSSPYPSAADIPPQPAIMPPPPSTQSRSPAAPTSFAALSATFTTSYPSLSLPVAGFDLPNSSSATSTTPIPAASSSSPAAPTVTATSSEAPGQSLHDLLAAAWEKRQRSSTTPTSQPTAARPAFYIPSAEGDNGGADKAGKRLSLPVPSWGA